MARTNMQSGTVKEDVTVTLDQGGGVLYAVTFRKGAPITLIVIDNSPPMVRMTATGKQEEFIP